MKICSLLMLFTCAMIAGCIENEVFTRGAPAQPQIDMPSLEDRAIRIVRDGLNDENGLVRNHAVEVVVTTNRRDLMPRVLSLLGDRSVALRFAAATAVGDMKYSEGEYAVKPMLHDPDVNVQIAAAYALGRIGRPEHLDKLRNAARSTDQTVRANALLLLGKLGDQRDLGLLYEILYDSQSSDKAKFQAVESIAMLKDPRIYKERLWPMLISKFADDRVMGIRGMAALGTKEAQDAILTMLDDEVLELRLCAAEQLGRLGDRTGEAEIAAYFQRSNPNINETSIPNVFAVLAIGQIRAEALYKYLPPALHSRSKVVQLAAAQSVLLINRAK